MLFMDWEGSGRGKGIDLEKLTKDPTYFQQILQDEFGEHTGVPHNYIIDRFAMEARITINKNPLVNQLPQFEVDLLFGGQFMSQTDQSAKQQVTLSIHQPQIIRILKLLEYIGYYNQFQSGALTRFKRRAISQQQADSYIKQYCEWRIASKDEKGKKEAAAGLRRGIREIEDQQKYL